MSSMNVPLAKAQDLDAFYGTGGALKLWDDKEAWCLRKIEESDFYPTILRRYTVRSVLDVAAASGFHAIQLASSGFSVTAIDGLSQFVEAGIVNQQNYGMTFPFLHLSWAELNQPALTGKPFDAVICLGGSLHHADNDGIKELFKNTKHLLRPGGIFIVEQRNYERLFAERPTLADHPAGWHYLLDYVEPRTIYFYLQDEARNVNVRFECIATFERELLPLARSEGFTLVETFYNYGGLREREAANWIEYIFQV